MNCDKTTASAFSIVAHEAHALAAAIGGTKTFLRILKVHRKPAANAHEMGAAQIPRGEQLPRCRKI